MRHKTLSAFLASRWPPSWPGHGYTCAGEAAQTLDTRTACSANNTRPHSSTPSANHTYTSRTVQGGQQHSKAMPPLCDRCPNCQTHACQPQLPNSWQDAHRAHPPNNLHLGTQPWARVWRRMPAPLRSMGRRLGPRWRGGGKRAHPPPHEPKMHDGHTARPQRATRPTTTSTRTPHAPRQGTTQHNSARLPAIRWRGKSSSAQRQALVIALRVANAQALARARMGLTPAHSSLRLRVCLKTGATGEWRIPPKAHECTRTRGAGAFDASFACATDGSHNRCASGACLMRSSAHEPMHALPRTLMCSTPRPCWHSVRHASSRSPEKCNGQYNNDVHRKGTLDNEWMGV